MATLDTIKLSDTFHNIEMTINPVDYELVYSFFSSFQPISVARNFTTLLFRIATETKIPVSTLIDNLKGKNKLEMNLILAYYMNSFKAKVTQYGVSQIPQPNVPVARNIVWQHG